MDLEPHSRLAFMAWCFTKKRIVLYYPCPFVLHTPPISLFVIHQSNNIWWRVQVMLTHSRCPKLDLLRWYQYHCWVSRYNWKRRAISVWTYYKKTTKRRIPARTVPLLEEDNDLTLRPPHSPVNDLRGHTCDLGLLYRVHSRSWGFYGAERNYTYPKSKNKSKPKQPFILLSK